MNCKVKVKALQHNPLPVKGAQLKLTRVVGVNFDEQLRNKVLEIKGGDVIIWDSGQRAKKGAIGSMTGVCSLDALHHAAQAVRKKNIGIAKDRVERADLYKSNPFLPPIGLGFWAAVYLCLWQLRPCARSAANAGTFG